MLFELVTRSLYHPPASMRCSVLFTDAFLNILTRSNTYHQLCNDGVKGSLWDNPAIEHVSFTGCVGTSITCS